MATVKAYGSITIVDISDLGTLSVYPEANSPTSIVYSPDDDKYNPAWTSTSPLQLNPVIHYGGKQLTYPGAANEISVKWFYKKGVTTGYTQITKTSSTTEAYVSGATLKVPAVPFVKTDLTDTNITYKCQVSYVEPNSGQTLTAEGQISFSLINQPASTKFCTITGESVFRYDSTKTLIGATSIELSARVVGCSVQSWQYKSGNNWITISGQTSAKLTVLPTDEYFDNNVATFKVVTDIEEVYDLHSITKLYDGAAGGELFLATLSNEDSYVACDAAGNPVSGAFDSIYTSYSVYYGDTEVTSSKDLTVVVTPQTGVTGEETTIDGKKVYKITGLSSLTGIVTFDFTYKFSVVENGVTVTKTKTAQKTMYLTKLKAGQDGVTPDIFKISCPTAVKKDKDGNYGALTITAEKIHGTTVTPYTGRYKILNGSTVIFDNKQNYETLTFTPSKGLAATTLVVQLYEADAFTKLLDTQTVTVVSDGIKGDPGADGAGGLSYIFANSAEQIPCSDTGAVASKRDITLPFAAYQGATRLACDATIESGLLDDMSITSNQSATTSADGKIVISIPQGKTLGGNDSGVIKIKLTTSKGVATYSFSWAKNKKGKDGSNGANAILLRTYSTTGNVINNGENDVVLTCTLLEGATDVTANATVVWNVFDHSASDYKQITSTNNYGGHTQSGATLTVPATAVDSYASYRVDVTYPKSNGKTYSDYIVVLDKTDPIQVQIFSTLGDKLTNGVGHGCVYARVYQNGKELDEIRNLTFSETNTLPSSGSANDVWVYINATGKEVIIKKHNGTSWETADFTDCNYLWKFADYSGKAVTFNGATQAEAKFIYVDGSLIDKKTQFNLEVTTN